MLKFSALFVASCLCLSYASCDYYQSYPHLLYSISPSDPKKADIRIAANSCPAENEQDVKNVTRVSRNHEKFRLKYCLFKKFTKARYDARCGTEIKPVLVPQKNENKELVKCSSVSDEGQNRYAIGFYLCGDANQLLKFHPVYTKFITKPKENHPPFKVSVEGMYDLCYDTKNKQTMWTRHTIVKPSLFDNLQIKNEIQYDMKINIDPFDLENPHFLEMKNEYELEKQNSPIRGMIPYPLTPSQHIALPIWKKAAYHILNIAPLWRDLVPLMFAIDEGLKKAQITLYKKNLLAYDKLAIYTKVITVEETANTDDTSPRSLKRNSDPVEKSLFQPNIWYKFVYLKDEKKGVIIRVHNTPHKTPKETCDGMRATCRFKEWIKGVDEAPTIANELWQFAYCCQTSKAEIAQLFSIDDVEIEDVLNLDSLIVLRERSKGRSRKSRL